VLVDIGRRLSTRLLVNSELTTEPRQRMIDAWTSTR
jgi:hypothetical protein